MAWIDHLPYRVRSIYYGRLYQRYTLIWAAAGRSVDEPEIAEWCREQFGPPGPIRLIIPSRWIDAGDAAYFLRPDDAFVFKMRWG